MPDPQHHGTLICWTNYCAVLCLGVVVMCVCVLVFFFVSIYALPGPLLLPLSLDLHYLLYQELIESEGRPSDSMSSCLYGVILFMMLSSSPRGAPILIFQSAEMPTSEQF